jgi:hypothetical protein
VTPFLVQDPETLNEILYKLRIETWISMGVFKEGEFKPEDFVDEHDSHAYHWAIKENNKVIAAARMCVHNSLSDLPDSYCYKYIFSQIKTPIASFNRLVVTLEFQKNGLSKSLDHIRIQKAIQSKCSSILIQVPETRINPLIEQGFMIIDKSGIEQGTNWLSQWAVNCDSIILKKELI